MSRKLVLAVALALVGSACGDDEGAAGGGGAAPAAAAAAAAAAAVAPLVPRVHIEERVPVTEKASIRHTFKERDFNVDQNRDPFQSYVVLMPGTPTAPAETNGAQQIGSQCTRKDQMQATNYSYADLKLVGIVAQGTQRKVLMMDSGNKGHIIKRGDCVGKEKAVVKDIGTGYLTLVVMPETGPNSTQRPPEEYSVQLHPTDLPLSDYSTPDNEPRAITPVMPPTAPTGPQRPVLQMPAPVPTPAGAPAAPATPTSPAPATDTGSAAPPPAQTAPATSPPVKT